MREAGLQRWIVEEIRRSGGYAVTVCPPVEAGTPDIVACLHGRFVGVEVKREGQRPSKLQTYRLNQIRQASGAALVIRSRDEFRRALSLLGSSKPSAASIASTEFEI